jgi:hypothetical protein
VVGLSFSDAYGNRNRHRAATVQGGMTHRLALSLALVLAAATAACATNTGSSAAQTSTRVSSAAHPSSSGKTSCTAHVVVGDADNGRTVCVALGSDVTILLHGQGWATPQVTGGALTAAGPIPTPAGAVGWSFKAVAAGSADLSTSHPSCPSAGPGALRCLSIVGYKVHVEVR